MRPLVFGQREPLVQALKTALAVGIAWAIAAHLLDHPLPYMAGIAAALTMQLTVYDSVAHGLQRAVGVVLGVVLVYLLGRLVGVHAWSVALMVLAGLVGAWALRLGPGVVAQIPITVMLVVAVGELVSGYAFERLVDSAVGAAVAIAINALIVPPSYVEPASRALADAARSTAALLRRVADGLARSDAPRLAAGWWSEAGTLAEQVEAAGTDVDRAEQSLRWTVARTASTPMLDHERRVLALLERTALRIRGVLKSLEEGLAKRPLGDDAVRALVELVEHTAAVVDGIPAAHDSDPDAARGAADAASVRFDDALERLRVSETADHGRAWIAYGSIAVDLRRILADTRGTRSGDRATGGGAEG